MNKKLKAILLMIANVFGWFTLTTMLQLSIRNKPMGILTAVVNIITLLGDVLSLVVFNILIWKKVTKAPSTVE